MRKNTLIYLRIEQLEMKNEISRLKKGIGETIDDLDEVLGEKDART